MPRITTTCPTTGRPVDTGITVDHQFFRSTSGTEPNQYECPECREIHAWERPATDDVAG